MKILQVTNFFKPSWESGGPARVCYEISKELVRRGHEVTVYTTDGFKYRLNVPKNKPIVVDGIKVYYFRNLSSYLSRKFVLPIPYYLPFIARKEIKNFDIIHLHEYRTFLNIVVSHYAIKYNVPYVLQPHGSLPYLFQREILKKVYDIIFGYKILKEASKLIVLNKTEEKQLIKLGITKTKINIIPNGINLEEFENLPKKGKFRKKYNIRKDEKIILCVGRLHKSKGIDLLISAFYEILKKKNNIKLVLVGPDDEYREVLEKTVKSLNIYDKILFTGYISDKEKIEAFVDADVFVNPRIDEIFGIVFLEAAACGTPVICSKRCGIAEFIDNKFGYAIENDAVDLEKAILKILEDQKLRIRFEKEGLRQVYTNFNWSEVCDEFEFIYESLINK